MKKLALTVIMVALLLITALPLWSHDGVTYAEWGTPVIDGNKEAIWATAQKIHVADEAQNDMGDETATAYVYSLWDAEYIYFYAEITDKTVDAEHKDDAWNQDAMGFMIDYSYLREPEVSFRDLGDDSYAGYVNVCAVEGEVNYPEAPTIFGIQKYIDSIQSYCKLTSTGYEIEIRLPLAKYKTYNPGDKIGFEICLNNSIGNGVRESQTVWKYADDAHGSNSWQYSYNMGTLIFNEKPAEPETDVAEPDVETPVYSAPAVVAAQTGDIAVASISILAVCLTAAVILCKKTR